MAARTLAHGAALANYSYDDKTQGIARKCRGLPFVGKPSSQRASWRPTHWDRIGPKGASASVNTPPAAQDELTHGPQDLPARA